MRYLICALFLFLPISLVEAKRANLFDDMFALTAVGAMSGLLGAANHAIDQVDLHGGLFDWGHEAQRGKTCEGSGPGATIALPDNGNSCFAAPCLGHDDQKAKEKKAVPKRKIRTRIVTA